MSWLDTLYETLDARASTETVAQIIVSGARLNPAAQHEALRVANAHAPWWVSSMADDWERAIPNAQPQLDAAAAQFGFREGGWGAGNRAPDPADPEYLRHVVTVLGHLVGGWQPGMDWKRDRLNSIDRASDMTWPDGTPGPPPVALKKRQYNRRIRVLRALSAKADRIEYRRAFRRFQLVGRAGFAHEIPAERFKADPAAACFIAYYVARQNRRRQFTLAAKENPIDALAQALYARCTVKGPRTDWDMIAMVYPRFAVVSRLTEEQRGVLMGRWWQVMADAALILAKAWSPTIDRKLMIVRRGTDSSTWNTMATAYNAARAGWINCCSVAGGELLEPFCPPKVMRVMAADLAYWHRASGGGVDPDTMVWSMLPFPWDVVVGIAQCDAAMVRGACQVAGVDPVKRGWTGPRAGGAIAEYKPTPELVHGVEIASPQWAALLRRAGVFGGHGKAKADAAELRVMAGSQVVGPLPAYLDGVLVDTDDN
jgi:hypothetical protein